MTGKNSLTAIPDPVLAGAFKALGHQHLACSLHLAGPDRTAILGDMVVIHATSIVEEVTQCLLDFRTASYLSQQMPESIYHSADTLGIVTKSYGAWPFTILLPAPKPVRHHRLVLIRMLT